MRRCLFQGLSLIGLLAASPILLADSPKATQVIVPVASAAPAPIRGTAEESAALATQLRTVVLQLLPDPLFEDASKWDQQKKNSRGKLKNDGRWNKVRITAQQLPDSLKLSVTNMVKEKSRKTFTVNISLPALVYFDRQTWRMGTRLYSGSTRARLRANLAINCELVTRTETSKSWVPDMIIRLRVLSSAFSYDNVVVEHTAGIGGDAARILGDMMLGIVKQAKPSLERKLIEKANQAIVKAGDTKEIRISLSDWLNGKAPAPPKK